MVLECLQLNQSKFYYKLLTLCLLVSSADDLCKQFGPISGPTKCWAQFGSNLFDTLKVFLKEFSKKLILKKNQLTTKKYAKFPSRQRVKFTVLACDSMV